MVVTSFFVGCFLFVLVGGGLVTALVLLIVGGIKKIKVMWITGAAVLAVTILLAGAAVVLGLLAARRAVQQSTQAMWTSIRATPMTPPSNGAIEFEAYTGVPLPPGASARSHVGVWANGVTHEHLTLTVPVQDQPALLANFTKAAWTQVQPKFGSPSLFELPDGSWPAAFADAACCTHIYTDSRGDRYQSWLVCEPGTDTIYLRVRVPSGSPQPGDFVVRKRPPSADSSD